MFDEMRKVAVCEDVYGLETTLSKDYSPKFFTYFRLKRKNKQHQTRKVTSRGKETLRDGTERKKKTQRMKRRNVCPIIDYKSSVGKIFFHNLWGLCL